MSLNSNLEIDQCLRSCKLTENTPRIYATGVHLVPMKIQIGKFDKYVWIVDDFNEDSFDSNGENISPNVMSDSIDNLYI